MSQENVEVVRRALAEVGGYPARIEGSAAFAQLVAPDIEVDLSDVYPDAPVVRGVEGWLRLVEPWGRSLKLQPERFFDVDDDRVLVFMRVTALGEGSGAPVELRNAHEYTIREGSFVRLKVYRDRDKALEAVGLRE